MRDQDISKRTKAFALRIIRLASKLPKNRFGDMIGRQVLKSGTSIGANYAEAVRASSKKHFISLVEIASREAAETLYWLELLSESSTFTRRQLTAVQQECRELLAILTASARTAKRRK